MTEVKEVEEQVPRGMYIRCDYFIVTHGTEDDASCEIEGTAILLRYKRPSLYPSMLS